MAEPGEAMLSEPRLMEAQEPRIWQAISAELFAAFTLGWSHYVELLTLDDPLERRFYEIEASANQWSVRELQRQIASSLYQRLALSRDKDEIRRLAIEGQVVEKAADLVKNPLVLEFLGLGDKPHYSEDDLERAIIDKLESFLLELGKGFLFEARQKRFTFDNDHFFVDLVFYNRLLRCYVLIDLKRDKLTHQDLGQMQMYVNYFDRHVKLPDELPTVGIVLCRRKSDALVELTLPHDANVFASRYQLYLPSREALKAELEKIATELGVAV
jgi:predicted nuclease of restriction endonuclease-like (RecB) superfamily